MKSNLLNPIQRILYQEACTEFTAAVCACWRRTAITDGMLAEYGVPETCCLDTLVDSKRFIRTIAECSLRMLTANPAPEQELQLWEQRKFLVAVVQFQSIAVASMSDGFQDSLKNLLQTKPPILPKTLPEAHALCERVSKFALEYVK